MDIYGIVAELRSERMCMVQNLVRCPKLCGLSALEVLHERNLVAAVWLDMDLNLYSHSRHTLFRQYRPPCGRTWGRQPMEVIAQKCMCQSRPSALLWIVHLNLFILINIKIIHETDLSITFGKFGSLGNEFLLYTC